MSEWNPNRNPDKSKPSSNPNGGDIGSWIIKNPPPDLQDLVVKYNGYYNIPEQAWKDWERRMRAWQDARRDRWMR